MRVLYDYQAFLQRHGGVSRYFAELIRELRKFPGFEALLPPLFSDNEYLEDGKTLVLKGHFKGKERIMGALNRLHAKRALRGSFDLFHPTYYMPYFLEDLRRPFVITVHDMIHEIFGPEHVRDDGSVRAKRLLCEKAARIIAVSGNTKTDICRILRIPESKISVIYHATCMRYAGGPPLHGRPYLLYVGSRAGYKNFNGLINAAAHVLPQHNMELVCAGGGPFTRSEKWHLRRQGLLQGVRHIQSPSPDELARLYHFASAFCYPSLYEGFGLPLLEAFACGCPVAASSASSIPEVAGDAAEYFDPHSPDSIADALNRLLVDRTYADALVIKGQRRLQSFSWEQTALKTYEVYQQVA